jgi:rare lipoprotein A
MKAQDTRHKVQESETEVSPFILHPSSLILAAAVLLAAMLAGCGSAPTREPSAGSPTPAPRGGGYYLDDGPGANPPANIDSIPDAVPRVEPIRSATSRPYVAMGKTYTPMTSVQPYKARGIATWYGRRYHGKPTASGEIYDMYSMSAAHPTLPIPSYARVTNLANGKSVVVRVNDRGPFVDGRIIDLSYSAAHRIGVLAGGSAMVEVEALLPDASGAFPASATRPTPPAPKPEAAPVAVTREPEPAAAPLASEPAPKPLPVAQETGGYFLQLGAFGSKDNADTFLGRMKAQLGEQTGNLQVYSRDGLYRVQAGPYASQAEARQAAERMNQSLGLKPMVLSR